MSDPTRREALGTIAAVAMAGAVPWTAQETSSARAHLMRARQAGQVYEPRFFQPAEWRSLRLLVDMILPADERSGSATEAEVPEFIDFILAEGNDEDGRVAVRGGLAWLDTECRERFGSGFADASETDRARVLDDIAWPERAPAHLSHGVSFFNRMRDLTASGFWSSQLGVEDLQYMGNTMIPAWTGCPPEQLRKLGLEP